MRLPVPVLAVSLLGLVLALGCGDGSAPATAPTVTARPAYDAFAGASARASVGFNGSVSGAPTGAVRLTGGGSFDPATASNIVPTETIATLGGSFRCTAAVAQGPLSGCGIDEGVRWNTAQLLASSGFKCTGADAGKTATTDGHTAVLRARFFRSGDGNDQSFTALMFIADHDLAPDLPGVQNFWIQNVGCGTATVNFN